MSQTVKQWWAIIEATYGTLSNFKDPTTVRVMRQHCIQWIADDVATVALLQGHPEELAAWDRLIEGDRAEIERVLMSCTKWLKARGLEP